MLEGYLKIKSAAKFVDVSERVIREWLKNGLPHSRINKKLILIKKESLVNFIDRFESTSNDLKDAEQSRKKQIDSIVDEMTRGLI